MEKKISVITAVYNLESVLRRCLDSLTNQTYRNLQILLVDDGSTDASGAICDEYARKDSRFTVLHQPNRGVYAARNAALELAEGEYIGFADADDFCEPDMFEFLLQNAEASGADITVCGHWAAFEDGRPDERNGVSDRMLLDTQEALALLVQDRAVKSFLWDKLFRRSLFDGLRFQEEKKLKDFAIMPQLFMRARTVLFLPQPKYRYFIRSDSLCHDETVSTDAAFFVENIRRMELISEKYPEISDLQRKKCCECAATVIDRFMKNKDYAKRPFPEAFVQIVEYLYRSGRQAVGLGEAGWRTVCLLRKNRPSADAAAAAIAFMYRLKTKR